MSKGGLWGLANNNTSEIHKKPYTGSCKIDEILPSHIIKLDSENEALSLIENEGYNGCAYCYGKKNTD